MMVFLPQRSRRTQRIFWAITFYGTRMTRIIRIFTEYVGWIKQNATQQKAVINL